MSFHLYSINELFSNADGSVQFIEMTVGAANGESFWQGITISVTQGGAPPHSFTFPSNLPSTATANTSVLIATQGFANLGVVTPDFIVPAGFLFVNGGTVNYAGVDSVTYASLPTDGTHSINRDGVSGVNSPRDFAGATGSVTAGGSVIGGTGNDTLSGGAGNDSIDGGAGIDTALYAGISANFTLARTATGYTVTDNSGSGGTDTLTNVERLQFSDKKLALDLSPTQPAGETAELIGAVLGHASLQDKQLVGQLLPFFDSGVTLQQAADILVNNGIMASLAGGADNKSLVDLVYSNVIGHAPDPASEASLQGLLDSHQYSQAEFLYAIAASSFNQTNVNLVGLANTGLEFA